MKTQNEINDSWLQEHTNHFDAAIGYYELQMLDEAEAELSKINPCVAAQSVPVLALLLAISCCRGDWNKMKAIARKLFLLDSSNPKWAFFDGYATGKIDSITDADCSRSSPRD
jgi:hypothetical protein